MADSKESTPPASQSDGNPLVALIIFFVFAGVSLAIAVGASLDRFELYSTGVIAEGRVISVDDAYETRTTSNGKGRSSSHITQVYDHDVKYAGFEHRIRQDEKVAAGSTVKVFYSTVNPKNAVISKDGKPWGFFRVLARPEIIFPLFFALFSLFTVGYCARLLMAKKQA